MRYDGFLSTTARPLLALSSVDNANASWPLCQLKLGELGKVDSMNYRATKIGLTCGEPIVRAWASYMMEHLDEVVTALRNENVRHEMWLMGRDTSLYVIGVMDVDDLTHLKSWPPDQV